MFAGCDVIAAGTKQSGNARITFNDEDYFKTMRHLAEQQAALPGSANLGGPLYEDTRIVEGQNDENPNEGFFTSSACKFQIIEELILYDFMFSESVTSQQRITNPNKIVAMRDVLSEVKEEDLPSHLQLGSTFTFQVSLVRASGISHDYADVFCQFKSVAMF